MSSLRGFAFRLLSPAFRCLTSVDVKGATEYYWYMEYIDDLYNAEMTRPRSSETTRALEHTEEDRPG